MNTIDDSELDELGYVKKDPTYRAGLRAGLACQLDRKSKEIRKLEIWVVVLATILFLVLFTVALSIGRAFEKDELAPGIRVEYQNSTGAEDSFNGR
jgi:hypothetical protein